MTIVASKLTVRKALAYCLAWTVASFFYFSQDLARKLYRNDPTPWQQILLSWLIGMYVVGALAPAVLWLGRRFPLAAGAWLRSIPLHFLFGAVFACTSIALETPLLLQANVVAPALHSRPFHKVYALVLVYGFNSDFLMYWIVLAVQAGARYNRELEDRKRAELRLGLQASELATQLSNARLNALKMQLQPHFLFNTLGAISVLVRQQQTRQAEEMLSRLSDLLRKVLSDSEAQEVSLRRELDYIKLYLSIEQVRFQDRLSISITPDPDVLDASVPHLSLQPIVENAVRHGLGRTLSAVHIGLNAKRSNGTLQLTVTDDGPGLPAVKSESTGIGLSNTRARLKQLYGDAGELNVENGPEHGVTVTMTLPYRLSEEAEECN